MGEQIKFSHRKQENSPWFWHLLSSLFLYQLMKLRNQRIQNWQKLLMLNYSDLEEKQERKIEVRDQKGERRERREEEETKRVQRRKERREESQRREKHQRKIAETRRSKETMIKNFFAVVTRPLARKSARRIQKFV